MAIGFTSAVTPIAQAQNSQTEQAVRPDLPSRDGDESQGCVLDWSAEAVVDPRFENPWSNRGFTEGVNPESGFAKYFQIQHYTNPNNTVDSRVIFATQHAINDLEITISLPEVADKEWSLAGTSDRLFGPDQTPFPNVQNPMPAGTIDGNTVTYSLDRVEPQSRFTVLQRMPMSPQELVDLTEPAEGEEWSNFFTITATAAGTLDLGSVEGCEFVFGYEDATTAPGVAVEPEKIGEFNFPGETKYSVATDNLPEGWTAEIDPDTGGLTVTPPTDAAPGDFADVTVTAALPGETTETTVVRVSIPTAGGGSSTNDRCIPTLLAAGIPLAFLIPIGMGAQLNIPGLDALTHQVQNAIRDTNTQLQQGIGAFDPETAIRVEQFNQQFGPQLADAAKGAGLVAAGLLALGLIADACQPDEDTSSGSSLSSDSSEDASAEDPSTEGTENGSGSNSSEEEEAEGVVDDAVES